MPIYDVKVVVEYMYEVEADNEVEAEEQGLRGIEKVRLGCPTS